MINALRPDPRIYSIGDIVFAQRVTKSVVSKGRVGKLMYSMTGPWRVVENLAGGSYRIEHQLHKGRFDKKHASMLSPYPLELVPFEPLDGPDNQFGQINQPIKKDAFIEAALKGLTPAEPFWLSANYAAAHAAKEFCWPSVAELNEELFPFPWLPNEREQLLSSHNSVETARQWQLR